MKKFSIYLDTSVINFLFADDAPEQRDTTKEFFNDYVKPGFFAVYISPVVIDEINRTKDELRKTKLLNAVRDYNLTILDIETRIREIQRAEVYLEKGIVPKTKLEDALHIAISTVYEMDVLLSWNFRHLANLNRERKTIGANIQEGYMKTLRITTPLEVMFDEEK